ncbi:MAG: ribose 5-phosphate isomerase B [Elusimicrobia bacterium]|nr:ribose 5-phosphate isomerase B [Elusimicrobiota bacterium]
MKIAVGSDHRGYPLKEELKRFLKDSNYEVIDQGTFSEESADYPIYAAKVARLVSKGEADKGVLCCGSGIGVSIAANKIKGVRAALVRTAEDAEITVKHNNSNVICLGRDRTSPEEAIKILKAFLDAEFEGGRHARRVEQISKLEEEK